jgi:hypothetical protein
VYAGDLLYELGGLRAILLLPMLGGVATALGALPRRWARSHDEQSTPAASALSPA